MVRRLLTSLYIRTNFIYTFQLEKIKISASKTVFWYYLYIGFELKERKIIVMFHYNFVFGCADLFFSVLFCLVFFWFYLFIIIFFRGGGWQIITSRGSDNLVFFPLIKYVSKTLKLRVLGRSLQFYSGYFERESIWKAWRHGEALGRRRMNFETTLRWLLEVFKILKRGFTEILRHPPPIWKYFYVYLEILQCIWKDRI